MTQLTRFAVRRPALLLGLWTAAVVALAVLGLPVDDKLEPTRLNAPGSSSAVWDEMRRGRFGDETVVILRGSPAALDAEGPSIAARLARATRAPQVSPWSGSEETARRLRPQPGLALVVLDISGGEVVVPEARLRALEDDVEEIVRPPVTAVVTGAAPLAAALTRESLDAAAEAEMIAIPILLVVLLLVFRAPLAAAIPLIVAAATVTAGRGLLVLAAEVMHLDAVAAVLLSMIGLALGVDYSLLIVTRFREAIATGEDHRHAAVLAAHTAGRTAAFAGVTLLAILMVTLLLAPGGVLVSASAGAIIGTLIGVSGALIATPALLILLGHRLPPLPADQGVALGRIVGRVLRHPRRSVVLAAAPLAVAALGLTSLRTAPPDAKGLPEGSPGAEALAAVDRAGLGAGFEVIVHRRDGPVTDPAVLREARRFERGLARLPAVRGVAGPGQLGTAFDEGSKVQMAGLRDGLRRARRGLTELRAGLTRAGDGASQLAAGGGRATQGAGALAGGTGRAREGARLLATGGAQAREGARRLTGGLGSAARAARSLAAGTARLQAGTGRTAEGAARLARALRDRLLPGIRLLAAGLAAGGDDLGALGEPARVAVSRTRAALADLRAMSLGLVDPRYGAAVENVGTALGALTGRDPRTGEAVRSDYRGLEEELADASRQVADAAAGARALATGSRDAATAARRVQEAVEALDRGARELREGAARVRDGLALLATGAGRAGGGLGALAAGGQELAGGLGALQRRTAELAAGLSRLREGQQTLAVRLRSARGRIGADPFAGQVAGEPALLRSGFAPLAALDTSGRRRRAAGSYLLDLDRGANTARIFVLSDLKTEDPRGPEVVRHGQALTRDFARRTGSEAAFGGLGAQLVQFDEATSARLPLIVVGVVLTTFLVLVPVLRSLLLPAIAVGLNVVTVAATFGILSYLFVGDDPVLGNTGALDIISACSAFAIIFALSIDYQVFLLARMREGYVLTQDPIQAIRFGIERTGRIVTGAALIMLGVFAAFATTDVANIQQFGVGLGTAILVDATLVRLVLLPAVMRLAGPRTWWLPDRLERALPELDVEGVAYVRTRAEIQTRAAEVW